LGFNFRLTNLQAALGFAQLERMEEIVAQKRWMGQQYNRRLSDLKGLQLPTEEPWARGVYWMYGIVVSEDREMDANQLESLLKKRGVETRPFFLGMHQQPGLRDRGLFRDEKYPVAERIARQGLYLPSGLALTEGQLSEVCSALRELFS
jgi:perosamine synthetase